MAEIDDTALADLTARAAAADAAIAAATADAASLATGVASYRDRVAAMHPTIPADVIAGDTFDAVDAAVASATRIADAAVAAAAAVRPVAVPPVAAAAAPPTSAGAPPAPADTSGMSPLQKVQAGLRARASGSTAQV
jgi:hypothetical protein